MKQPRIDNPCPMLIARMQQSDEHFFCNSCKKEVIDFRDKSPDEIAATIQKGSCGIFNEDQLPAQSRMPFFRRILFAGLTVLSFLGFNVGPLNAAPAKLKRDLPSIAQGLQKGGADEDDRPKKKRKKKKKNKRGQRTKGVVGYI